MPLPSFTVTGNLLELLGNTAGSEIVGNGLGGGIPAQVIFNSNVPANAFVIWDSDLYRVSPVVATVKTDGEILRDGEPVQLLANDPGLNVEGLQWFVDIGHARLVFDAPLDGDTVDLASAVPVAQLPVTVLPSLTVAGLSDASAFIKSFLTTADDATEARNTLQAVGLVQAAKNPDVLVTGAITLDSNDLVVSAAVVWPDGSPGTLTITSRDSNNAVLAYTITYGSPVTKTFTQPAITRNANGAATNVPAIVVT